MKNFKNCFKYFKFCGEKILYRFHERKTLRYCLALCCNDIHTYLKRRKDDQFKV